jgi:dephospho-CoA kinase
MLKIGLTGGIGSGKSTVSKIFSSMGIPVFEADQVGREVLEWPEVRTELEKLFGSEAVRDGQVNRAHIASVVFGNQEILEELNAIVHPRVGKAFNEWCAQEKCTYIIKEAAIIFEAGTQDSLDGVILVSAPEKLRIERVMQRDGMSQEQVQARMRNQWPEERKREMSDYELINDGKLGLIPQVMDLHTKLMKLK